MSAEGQIFTIENLCKLLHMSGEKKLHMQQFCCCHVYEMML